MAIELVTVVVDEYDPAIEFFVDGLGFDLVEDTPSETDGGHPKRWVVVRPPDGGTGLLLAQADSEDQRAAVGQQAGGRVGHFLRVDDFDAMYARMVRLDVEFDEEPRIEPYGKVVVWRDIAGNPWDLLGPAPDPDVAVGNGDDITHYDLVEGYCNALSYHPGDTVELCASTQPGAGDLSVLVSIERWGATRERVWVSEPTQVPTQPTATDADAFGCGWATTFEIPVGVGWRSGFYLANFEVDGVAVGHASFTLLGDRANGGTASTLFVLGTNTWNAYNTWGGRSLYSGGHRVAFGRPWGRGMLVRPEVERDDRKARPRYSGEHPDTDGSIYQAYRHHHGYPGFLGSAGWFTHERRFVEWAERAEFVFDYATSTDLAELDLSGYRRIISAGHDEYWSADQRAAIEGFVAAGGDYASFSGNTMFWQVRHEAGQRGTSMVCHKYRAHLDDPIAETEPAAMTGLWSDAEVGRPESNFLGAGSAFGLYHRFGMATARGVGGFVVYRDDHWLLAGTGLRYGDVLGADHGVVGYETVGCRIGFDDENLPVAIEEPLIAAAHVPVGAVVVAFTPATNLAVGEYPASISAASDQGDLEFVAERVFRGGELAIKRARHGNAVMMCCRPFGAEGGEVVTIGSTDWVFGLSPGGNSGLSDPLIEQVTANVLNRSRRKSDADPRSGHVEDTPTSTGT